MTALPLIGIPCNRSEFQEAPAHVVKHQYISPLIEAAKCIPVLIPAIGSGFRLKEAGGKINGLLLTGATSNVCPTHYGAIRKFRKQDLDTDRDETSLPLIQEAIKADVPVFAICRGFQELNVACGGTLHQHVHKQPGMLDHRGDKSIPLPERYAALRHKVRTQEGGIFERLRLPAEFQVNSLHNQGIDRLGKGLFTEAVSEDGLIEAISVPETRFVVGVQWHPEADFKTNPVSKALFEDFGRAVRA
jgi:putative glutamine amidotransferase